MENSLKHEKRETLSSLKVYTFEKDTKLCVVATLEKYLKRTNVWRRNDKSILLLSLLNPILSEWTKNIFREVGIDIEIFKRHPKSSASASKKLGFGKLSVTDILKRGFWSNA